MNLDEVIPGKIELMHNAKSGINIYLFLSKLQHIFLNAFLLLVLAIAKCFVCFFLNSDLLNKGCNEDLRQLCSAGTTSYSADLYSVTIQNVIVISVYRCYQINYQNPFYTNVNALVNTFLFLYYLTYYHD